MQASCLCYAALRFGAQTFTADLGVLKEVHSSASMVLLATGALLISSSIDGALLAAKDFRFIITNQVFVVAVQLLLLKATLKFQLGLPAVWMTFAVLLKHPAFGKLSSRDVQGRSPLERAIREGRLQTSRFLKQQKLRIAHRLDIDDHGIVLQQAPDNSLEHDAGLPSRDLEKVELPLVDNARASSTVAAIKGGERPDILDYDGLPEVQAPGYVEVAERPSTYTDNLALPSKVQTFGFGEAELPAGVDDTHRRSIAATATKGSERPTTSGDKEDGFPMLSEVEAAWYGGVTCYLTQLGTN
eukprot:g29542.t1